MSDRNESSGERILAPRVRAWHAVCFCSHELRNGPATIAGFAVTGHLVSTRVTTHMPCRG